MIVSYKYSPTKLAEAFSSSVVYKWMEAAGFCMKALAKWVTVFHNKVLASLLRSQPAPPSHPHQTPWRIDCLPSADVSSSLVPSIRKTAWGDDIRNLGSGIHKQGIYLCIQPESDLNELQSLWRSISSSIIKGVLCLLQTLKNMLFLVKKNLGWS